jgi:hypothetical protein
MIIPPGATTPLPEGNTVKVWPLTTGVKVLEASGAKLDEPTTTPLD